MALPVLLAMVRYVTPLGMDIVVYQLLVEMSVPDKLRCVKTHEQAFQCLSIHEM